MRNMFLSVAVTDQEFPAELKKKSCFPVLQINLTTTTTTTTNTTTIATTTNSNVSVV
jgi:hypothetical protein